MNRKPSFANLRSQTASQPPGQPIASPGTREPVSGENIRSGAHRPISREGRKQIAGFFTPQMSLAMHMLARRQSRSLQALMTEAFDDVLRKHGESPIGG